MRTVSIFLLLLLLLSGLASAQNPTWQWLQQIGGPGNDYFGSVATDLAGNTVATGAFDGTVQLGTTSLVCPTGSNRNIYVAKYDATGGLLWARRAGDAGPGGNFAATSADVTTDAAGNIYVVGGFIGTMTFGNITISSANYFGANAFVVKYSATGTPLWAKSVSGQTGSDVQSVAVDANGNVLVAGTYSNTISFGALSLTTSNAQGSDVFLAKYDNQGVIQWARSAGGSSDDNVSSIGLDAQGNIFIAGYFSTSATFGTQIVVSNGLLDVFLAKYDGQGVLTWVNSYGGPDNDFSASTAVDASGNVYLSGTFNATATFSSTLSLVSQGSSDGFVSKCNGNGSMLWARQIGGSGDDELFALTTASNGEVYALGSFEGTITLGSQTLVSAGNTDAVLTRLNSAGNVIWAVRGGGTGYEVPFGVAIGLNGHLSLTVGFGGSTQFGSFSSTSRGQYDMIVLQLQDNTPLSTKPVAASFWQAYPNPFSNQLTLDVPSFSQNLNLTLRDVNGREVMSQKIVVPSGQQRYLLSIADNLPSGTYWLQLSADGLPIETRRLVKLN